MKRISYAFACIYLLAAAADIIFISIANESARVFSKPLLMLTLSCLYVSATRMRTSFSKIWLAALLFCWLGDVLLMRSGFFVQGLLAFLAAHITYIIYLFGIAARFKQTIQISRASGIIVLTFWLLFLVLLIPYLGELKIPVVVYATIICFFWLLALNVTGNIEPAIARLFSSGAIMFVLSDSILAINKFVYTHPSLSVAVMISYSLAQFLLTVGSIKQVNNLI